MGPREEQRTGTLYVIENGEYREIGQGITPLTLTIPIEDGFGSFPIEIERNTELTFSLTVDALSEAKWKMHFLMLRLAEKRCRSRKRFVKMTMGLYLDRDSANNLANLIRRDGMSWQQAWRELCMELAI